MMGFRESFYDAITDKNSLFADLLVNSKDLMEAQLPDRPDLYDFPRSSPLTYMKPPVAKANP